MTVFLIFLSTNLDHIPIVRTAEKKIYDMINIMFHLCDQIM